MFQYPVIQCYHKCFLLRDVKHAMSNLVCLKFEHIAQGVVVEHSACTSSFSLWVNCKLLKNDCMEHLTAAFSLSHTHNFTPSICRFRHTLRQELPNGNTVHVKYDVTRLNSTRV